MNYKVIATAGIDVPALGNVAAKHVSLNETVLLNAEQAEKYTAEQIVRA